MNICGLLVHAHPHHIDAVSAALSAMPGVELHHRTDDGRLIVTAEDGPAADQPGVSACDQILQIHRLPGVISAALTYHHFEPYLNEAHCGDAS